LKSNSNSQPDGKLVLSKEQRDDGLPAPEAIANLPAGVQSLFRKPLLLPHEDPDRYDALRQAVEAAIQPRDLFEYFWVRDFTDLTWEIERYRRLRVAVLEETEREAVRQRFRVRVDTGKEGDLWALDAKAAELTHKWFDMNPYVDNIEKERIIGRAFCLRSKEIDQLEKHIAACESRPNKVLRELESRRDTLAARNQLMQVARRAHEFFASQIRGAAIERTAVHKSTRATHLLPARKAPSRRPRARRRTDQG
jgi:hypothetical protein